MSSQIGKLVRNGLIAVGLLAAVAAPAAAAPLARGAVPPVETSGALNPILVQEGGSGRWSACTRDGRNCAEHPNWRRDGLRYDRRAWRDGRRNWEHQWQRPRWQHRDRRWDRRDWRMHHRPYRFHRAPVIQFNLGSPGYRYVDPYYEAPRRYVVRLSAAHVEYCRSRYKSYRVSDNSWKPYHGPRRQCLSPYS